MEFDWKLGKHVKVGQGWYGRKYLDDVRISVRETKAVDMVAFKCGQ